MQDVYQDTNFNFTEVPQDYCEKKVTQIKVLTVHDHPNPFPQ